MYLAEHRGAGISWLTVMVSQMILLIALILFVYPFALYPAILFLLGRMRPDHSAARLAPVHSPTAAIVVCALNED